MGVPLIVEASVLLAQDLSFEAGGEQFSVEQFVTKAAIEALDEAILPGSARFDVAGVYIRVLEVSPEDLSKEPRSVVGAHAAGLASQSKEPVYLR